MMSMNLILISWFSTYFKWTLVKRYINVIRKFISKKGNKVEGIVWWESSKKAFLNYVKQPSHLENEKVGLNSTDILINYTSVIN
jgi:hypothetical protein